MYTKTQWVDNVTDIDKNNLNKIEQGIYDNSLVVDAVTNTLNPTDTETYKTAELTEGQITDVIGVNDILIKGQTSQDGEPTPSSPIDVNVVSGSNVINISNKNLFDKNNVEDGKYINANGTVSASVNYVTTDFIRVYSGNKYYLPKTNTRRLKYFNSNKQVLSSNDWDIATSTTGQILTIPDNAYYVRFSIDKAQVDLNAFQFEQSSTATTYEPHQGKELHLDLGSIELCKIGDYQDYFYKSGSKWYLHKEIIRTKLDGSESISTANTGTANWYYRVVPNVIKEVNFQTNQICNYYNNVEIFNSNTTQGIMMVSDGAAIRIRYGTEDTVANFKTWLSNNNVILYCQLKNATNTEITDTTLISQLEAIYNAPLYEQTNITQTNNDLPMVLDITACKDNINGIKAFIRK